jgi:ABC-2 type transport system permease protein
VSVDLSNDALPLYLARPLSRTEYVLGKFSVIFLIISAITWVPGMILIALQASLSPVEWLQHNYWLFGSMFIGSLLWIAIIGLLSLALSAWVRWRIVSTAAMLVVFFAFAGFGEVLNNVLRTKWGFLLNIGYVINVIWFDVFRMQPVRRFNNRLFELPSWSAWMVVLILTAACVWMLNRKLKAREVVR